MAATTGSIARTPPPKNITAFTMFDLTQKKYVYAKGAAATLMLQADSSETETPCTNSTSVFYYLPESKKLALLSQIDVINATPVLVSIENSSKSNFTFTKPFPKLPNNQNMYLNKQLVVSKEDALVTSSLKTNYAFKIQNTSTLFYLKSSTQFVKVTGKGTASSPYTLTLTASVFGVSKFEFLNNSVLLYGSYQNKDANWKKWTVARLLPNGSFETVKIIDLVGNKNMGTCSSNNELQFCQDTGDCSVFTFPGSQDTFTIVPVPAYRLYSLVAVAFPRDVAALGKLHLKSWAIALIVVLVVLVAVAITLGALAGAYKSISAKPQKTISQQKFLDFMHKISSHF
jgi:hypothetical protein